MRALAGFVTSECQCCCVSVVGPASKLRCLNAIYGCMEKKKKGLTQRYITNYLPFLQQFLKDDLMCVGEGKLCFTLPG